ncbi:MAG: transketolase, partial [Gammaproteobacteria bacterium]
THGAALGEDEVAAARKELGWKYPPFEIPEDIYAGWDARARGKEMESDWNQRLSSYKEKHPELGAEFERRIDKRLPDDWSDVCETFLTDAAEKTDRMATRKASQVCLDAYGPHLPEFIGGSADLTGSNNTFWSGSKDITKDPDGNYIFFGVREFGMSAICNGIGLHGGFIPYSGTFLIFSDYARNAVRMSALMGIRTIFVYTHDSIGLGEDGPTHQPVEHLTSLRAMPNMVVWRPCDLVETAVAWRQAIERRDGPTSLVLTRQGLAPQERTEEQRNLIARGGYILYVSEKEPRALIIATGSEVDLAVRAAKTLNEQSIGVYVVSMPSAEVFEQQDKSYRDAVLPPDIRARVAVEAGATLGWSRYVGLDGKVIGLDRFGASAPARDVFEYFGFRASNVVDAVKSLVK